jgi:glycosyltransferase involved in cell wall biosynthesis
MNILFWNEARSAGGGETWIISAARKLRDRGHSLHIASSDESWLIQKAKQEGLSYLDYPFESEHTSLFCNQMSSYINKKQIDIVYYTITGFKEELMLLNEILRQVGRGIGILTAGVQWLPARKLDFGVEDRLKMLTVVSHHIRDWILEKATYISPDRIKVIYQGVDLSVFNPDKYTLEDRKKTRSELGIVDTSTVIASIGRLVESKRHSILLHSAKQVIERHPEVSVMIVGAGGEENNLRKLAKELNIAEKTIFTGFRDDVVNIMNSIELLVHPSVVEGLGLVIMEAMAMLKPVIATAVGGIPEVVVDGETGILIPADDCESLTEAILRMLSNRQIMLQMGKAGRKRIELYFDRDISIVELERVFTEELERGGIKSTMSR